MDRLTDGQSNRQTYPPKKKRFDLLASNLDPPSYFCEENPSFLRPRVYLANQAHSAIHLDRPDDFHEENQFLVFNAFFFSPLFSCNLKDKKCLLCTGVLDRAPLGPGPLLPFLFFYFGP